MNTCPCCDSQLLPHIRSHKTYWFCPGCWQEMPSLSELIATVNLSRHKQRLNAGLAMSLAEK